jgi:hypothetical protein
MAKKADASRQVISFALPEGCRQNIKNLAAGRQVRLSGEVRNGILTVDKVTFTDGKESVVNSNKAFVALNAPFRSKAEYSG